MGSRIGAFWSHPNANNDEEAEKLIASHLRAVPKRVRFHQRKHPHEDIEAHVMWALYHAAFSYRPGPGSFYFWWGQKIRGEMSNIRRREARRRRGLFAGSVIKPGETRQHASPIEVYYLSPDKLREICDGANRSQSGNSDPGS